MTRIAGVMLERGQTAEEARRRVVTMLQAVASAGTRPLLHASDEAAIGVTGDTSGGITSGRGGRVIVVLDGAIYNRDELGVEGSDAEAITALYEQHGFEALLARLNGDFAIALYDTDARTLWVGRDRFGVKPLYFTRTGGQLAFASRLRSLLALVETSRRPCGSFVARFAGSHYRTFDNDPHATPFEGVEQLPAGQLLCFRDGQSRLAVWWRLNDVGELDEAEDELAERYRSLLLDAVRRRVERSPGYAFTLSGGMDSSSVLACAVDTTGRRQHAFSTVYDDTTYDESDEIRSMLDSSVEAWHPVRIDTPHLELDVPRMIEANDEPVATATWLSHFHLCRETSRSGFRGLFGGLGGDELNAGEYEHFFFFFADLAAMGDERRLLAETAKWVEYHDHPIHQKNETVMRRALRSMVDLSTAGRCLPDTARQLRYAHALEADYANVLRSFAPVMDIVFPSYLKNRAYQDIFRETAPCCLRAADRHTAPFGLEMRWPFFDHRLVEFMFRIPSTMKIRDGVTKHLLRQAMRGILAEETRTRINKTGWNAPAHQWFCGRGRELVLDIIGSSSFASRGIYDASRVRSLLDEHQRIVQVGLPVDNHMMFFWQLVNMEFWLRWCETLPTARLDA